MSNTTSGRRWRVVLVAAFAAILAISTAAPAHAERELFFEETASAFWAVPHTCADGSTVQAMLLVITTRDFEAPDTEDEDPTARVQYQAVCPGGISFSWIGILDSTITSTDDLKSVAASGSGTVREPSGVTHQVSYNVAWTGTGPIMTEVNGPGSKRKERVATATGQVTFDGDVLVDGTANHPTRDAPFIRVDTEK